MKLISLLTLLLLSPLAAQDRLAETLRQGVAAEETGRNPDDALSIYQSVLAQYDAERKTAATALFRLAETYRKQGKKEQAQAAYARVVQEFADQTKLAALSRAQVPKAKSEPPAPARSAAEARQEYRQLLLEEIKFSEQDAKSMKLKYELGAESQQSVVTSQQQLNEAKLRLEAFDLNQLEGAKGGRR
jgi:hypothetical protein